MKRTWSWSCPACAFAVTSPTAGEVADAACAHVDARHDGSVDAPIYCREERR